MLPALAGDNGARRVGRKGQPIEELGRQSHQALWRPWSAMAGQRFGQPWAPPEIKKNNNNNKTKSNEK